MHTVDNYSLCLETSCTSWIYILLESFEVVSPTSLFQGKDLWLSLFSREITSCKSHFVNDTIIIMSPNFAQFLLDTTNNGNEILAVLEDIVEVTETGGTDL